jgi:hypothetical protein
LILCAPKMCLGLLMNENVYELFSQSEKDIPQGML